MKKGTEEKINIDVNRETLQSIAAEVCSVDFKFENKDLADRLYKNIEYAIKRYEHSESEKNKMLGSSLSLSGLLSIFIGLLVNSNLSLSVKYCSLLIVFIMMTSIGTVMYHYFASQKQKYNHRKIADITSWFFSYTINSPGNDIRHHLIESSPDDADSIKKIKENYRAFLRKWNGMKDSSSQFILEDIQQLYILYILQSINARSLSAIIDAIRRGLAVVALIIPIMLALLAIDIGSKQ